MELSTRLHRDRMLRYEEWKLENAEADGGLGEGMLQQNEKG
jgi:hypothetical protein